jgi:hypothetical protein
MAVWSEFFFHTLPSYSKLKFKAIVPKYTTAVVQHTGASFVGILHLYYYHTLLFFKYTKIPQGVPLGNFLWIIL